MKYVFILYIVTFFGDNGSQTSGFKIYGNTYWDAARVCEVAGKSKLNFDKDKKYAGFYCEAAKDNPQF